jgi:hypothetical protein
LVQKSICSDFPKLDSSFFGFELYVEYSIAFGSERDGVVIDELKVIIRSELEFGCSWDSSFVFKID